MERALLRPAGDPPLREPRGRPLRPAARHRVLPPCRVDPFRRGDLALAGRSGGSRRTRVEAERRQRQRQRQRQWRRPVDRDPPCPLRHHGHGLPVGGEPAGLRRDLCFQGGQVPHRRLAARGGRLHRAQRRHHRYRVLGDSGDSPDRRAGASSVRLPTHAELLDSGPQSAHGQRPGGGGQGGVPGIPGAEQADARRARGGHEPDARFGAGGGRRGAPPPLRRALVERWLLLHGVFRRPAADPGSERRGGAVRAGEDPRHRPRPGHGNPAQSAQRDRVQAHLSRQRLLRDLQPAQRVSGRRQFGADRDDHRTRRLDRWPRVRAGSSSPPASTP